MMERAKGRTWRFIKPLLLFAAFQFVVLGSVWLVILWAGGAL